MNIAVVVPTCREEKYQDFYVAWKDLFKLHNVHLVAVRDGDTPTVEYERVGSYIRAFVPLERIMGNDADLIYNRNDGVRNLGFAFVAKHLENVDYIISFDDDVAPVGDPISDHVAALNRSVCTSWLSTTIDSYMRGFPYGLRHESEVVLSHGVWENVPDLDAATQLLHPDTRPEFYKGPIPKGVKFPLCAMNVAFKRKLLPYIYQAPMGPRVGLDRFADIWGGIEAKRDIDEQGWAAVTGYARIFHTRASDVFTNLKKEAAGLEINEHYGEHEYFKLFLAQRNRWKDFICGCLS